MNPTPVTTGSPTGPAAYTWEATNEAVADRYGLPVDAIVRFDLNTSPSPPAMISRFLAAGMFETPLSEYPPADYRRLVEAAAARYGVEPGDLLVGAGADEILDIIAKAFIPAGGTAVIPTPTYAMYHVLTDQRAARSVFVSRLCAADGHRLDVPGLVTAAAGADLVWLCNPNNPTGLEEPDGTIEAVLDGLAAIAAAGDRRPPIVVIDEAYAEFTGRTHLPLRARYPDLVLVRTLSKAYALAGIRVGFAIAGPEVLARMAPYRPPGSVSVVSVSLATAVLSDPDILDANIERVETERARLAAGLAAAGWQAGPSVTNFLLVNLGTRERAAAAVEALMGRGLVPRSFGPAHPLADHLRITVRNRAENDRLIEAVRAIEQEAHP